MFDEAKTQYGTVMYGPVVKFKLLSQIEKEKRLFLTCRRILEYKLMDVIVILLLLFLLLLFSRKSEEMFEIVMIIIQMNFMWMAMTTVFLVTVKSNILYLN